MNYKKTQDLKQQQELEHFGVLGMHWGVRKGGSSSSGSSKSKSGSATSKSESNKEKPKSNKALQFVKDHKKGVAIAVTATALVAVGAYQIKSRQAQGLSGIGIKSIDNMMIRTKATMDSKATMRADYKSYANVPDTKAEKVAKAVKNKVEQAQNKQYQKKNYPDSVKAEKVFKEAQKTAAKAAKATANSEAKAASKAATKAAVADRLAAKAKAVPKAASTMSDDELKTVINRINMENQYASLTESANSKAMKAAKSAVSKSITGVVLGGLTYKLNQTMNKVVGKSK